MDSGASSPKVTVGQFLKEARSAKGLTIEEAAAASKVPLYLVRLMEGQQFHLVPDPLYVLRFLSEYSGFLGLDPKQVETQFRRQVHPSGGSTPLPAMVSRGSRVQRRRLLLYLVPAAAAAPLILIMLSLLSGRPPEPPSSRRPQPPAPQEASPQPTQAAPSAAPIAQEAASGGERQARVEATQDPTTAPGERALQSQPSRYTLRAKAKETTWMAVSVDGAARQQVLLHPGNAAQWSAHRGFVVTIGNSEGIALSLNGKLVHLTGAQGRVIQRLALPGKSESMRGQ